jgi:cytochrome c biogenesis protein CcmG/thiol:disulfide interchange protein DsbE
VNDPTADVPAEAPPPRRRVGTWVAAGVVLIVIVFGAVFASRFGRDPDLVASPLIGQPAPALTLPLLEAVGDVALADLEGDIVVVNFWASWCTGCRVEHDALLAAAAAYRDAGVSFLGILHQDRPPTGIGFLDDFGRGDPYRYVVDEGSRAGIEFGVLGLPTTFFLDRAGTIVGQVNGPVSLDVLIRTIDAILLGGTVEPITETGELENR